MLQAGHPDSGEVLLIGKRVFGCALAASLTLLAVAPMLPAHAQNAAAATQTSDTAVTTQPEVLDFKALAEQGKALVEEARKGKGSQGIVLAKYNGSYTMLTARTQSGGAEMHEHFDDYLFVLAGEGTELTGGTIVDSKTGDHGEVKGSRLEGASAHVLHQGDVIHIPAGTPHQAIEAPGQTITIYVVKVEQPSIVR